MENKQIEEVLNQQLNFYHLLSKDDQNLLLENTRLMKLSKGQNIHSPTHHCLGMLLVVKGNLRVYLLSDEGKEVTLYNLKENDYCILSAGCILNALDFDVFIDASVDSEVYLIHSDLLAQLQSRYLEVENDMLKSAVEKFSDVIAVLQQLIFTSLDERLARLLLDELSKTGSNTLSLTHLEIAQRLTSAREVISRKLKKLELAGVLSVKRNSIEILDVNKLKKLI